MKERPMNKTIWNDKRLRRLFDRYNRLHFRGKLSNYKVAIDALPDGARGICDWSRRTITIDPEHHVSDREVRGTVLHEMAHAACAGVSHGHDIHFFAEVESLLRCGAPVTIDFGEAGNVIILADLVPSRFPLLKRKMDRLEVHRQKEFEEGANDDTRPPHDVTEDEILRDFEELAMDAKPWKRTLTAVGREYGLTDECGRPLTAWARRLVAKARKLYSQTRRDQLKNERERSKFFKMKPSE
jgi:hypothetical protein